MIPYTLCPTLYYPYALLPYTMLHFLHFAIPFLTSPDVETLSHEPASIFCVRPLVLLVVPSNGPRRRPDPGLVAVAVAVSLGASPGLRL